LTSDPEALARLALELVAVPSVTGEDKNISNEGFSTVSAAGVLKPGSR